MQSVLRGVVRYAASAGQPRVAWATMAVAGREEAHTMSRGAAQGRWPWGKSQEVKGGNTLA